MVDCCCACLLRIGCDTFHFIARMSKVCSAGFPSLQVCSGAYAGSTTIRRRRRFPSSSSLPMSLACATMAAINSVDVKQSFIVDKVASTVLMSFALDCIVLLHSFVLSFQIFEVTHRMARRFSFGLHERRERAEHPFQWYSHTGKIMMRLCEPSGCEPSNTSHGRREKKAVFTRYLLRT